MIYVDTNVLMDFLLGRDKSAFQLLMRAISCEFCILVSNIVAKELHFNGFDTEMKNLFSILKNMDKLIYDCALDSDHITALEIIKNHPTHYADALHKTIAKRNNVRYFVTKNIKDFACFNDIIVMRPDAI